MGHQDQRTRVVGKGRFELGDERDRHVAGRLVEQHQVRRFAGQKPGEREPPSLAGGERPDRNVQLLRPEEPEREQPCPMLVLVSGTPSGEGGEHGALRVDWRHLLWQVGDPAAAADGSLVGHELPGQHPQEGRLPGTVRPVDEQPLPRLDLEPVDGEPVAHPDALKLGHDSLRRTTGELDAEPQRFRRPGNRIVSQPSQPLLGLPDPACDRALHSAGVPVVGHLVVVLHRPAGCYPARGGRDGLLEPLDLLAPGLVRLLPPPPGGRAFGQEAVVAAAIPGHRAVRHLDDRGGDPLEKQPVVRDHDQDSAMLLEPVLKPGRGGIVEVIGGFVEEHDLGCGRQQARQPKPGLLAAGKPAQRTRRFDVAYAEGLQCLLDPGAGLIAATQLVGAEQVAVLGQPVPGEVGFELAHPALHFAEVGQRGVDGLADRASWRQPESLAEMADAMVGGDRDRAVVRRRQAGDQPQQGGLAGTVLADEPDALTWPDGQRDMIEDDPAWIGLGDSPQGELSRQDEPPMHERLLAVLGTRPTAAALQRSMLMQLCRVRINMDHPSR